MTKQSSGYMGYEIGPIRPPSEARSLLLRVSRNCPWNNCRFCGLYKDKPFSIRKPQDVMADIDQLKKMITALEGISTYSQEDKQKIISELYEQDANAYHMALTWKQSNYASVFLQDADSLAIKPTHLIQILEYLKSQFPEIQRITAYSSSRTIKRISGDDLNKIGSAGLNRIHIGMESGCNEVLDNVAKGATYEDHVASGRKIKAAGIELSEYYMPGLGGKEKLQESAIDTALAMNAINPDFIRIRTLAVGKKLLIAKDYQDGTRTRTTDEDVVKELLIFLEKLEGIDSTIVSDHFLNLIPEFEGKLPEDKEKMANHLKWFLELDETQKMIYQLGRRTGRIHSQKDFYNQALQKQITQLIDEHRINPDNIHQVINQLMRGV